MRFGVLGPLQVWTAEGEPVPIPETKVRALLADLLVHQGRPVPAAALIDDLWGNDLPANPTSALQLKVSRLRNALESAEQGAGKRVVSHASGYLLKTDPDGTDADRFAELICEAQRAVGPETRTAVLAEALALWRGPAFADHATEGFVRAASHRLEEQRLSTIEAQAEARLELGDFVQLAAELGDLVDRYPLRERLRAVQLRALYGAGRQVDALAGYQRLREQLADELGLDPGPDLVALHQKILQRDPALDPPASTVARAVASTNLPAPLTDLVGRTQAIAELRSRLAVGRLVTLTGPGGVGKTRLAIETARPMVDHCPDGAWLVELAGYGRGISSAEMDLVPRAIAAVLGIRDDILTAGAPLSSSGRLAEALRAKRLLLILDNCEHVIGPVAEMVELLLREAPDLRVLATSREPLALAGETVWPVPTLALPSPSAPTAELAQAEAVQLFVQRTAAVAPYFTLDDGNAQQIGELCRRLDGIPLALELAATRMPSLGVREFVGRLDDRFRLLTAGRRDAPERQQTLRAVMDWSWDLLSDPERAVLRRLAVHPGGCTLTAAEAVCSGGDVRADQVVDLLARLVDRSLVTVKEDSDGARYHLLETVADYCLQRLRDAGELAPVQDRFHRYYLALAKRAEPRLRGHDQRRWLDRLDRESANVSKALDGMAHQGDDTHALELAMSLVWCWFLLGRLCQARSALERLLSPGTDVPAGARAIAGSWLAGMTLLTGWSRDDATPAEVAERMLADIEEPRDRARAQWFLGFAIYTSAVDLAASEDLVHQALDTFREIGDQWGTAAALATAANQAMVRGNLHRLEQYGEQSAELFRELGDAWGYQQTVRALAYLAEAASGDYERAARLQRDGLRQAEELRLWPQAADRLSGLGRIALLQGDFAQSRELHERARRLAAQQNYKVGEKYAEVGLALTARREGDLDDAEERLNSLLAWHHEVGFAPGTALVLAELGYVAEQRGDAESALARHFEGLTAARTAKDPRSCALVWEGLAGAQNLLGQHDQAARLLGAADAARRSVGAPLPAAERGDCDRITARARSALGEEAFAAEFGRGAEMEVDQCVAMLRGSRSTNRVPPRGESSA
ncbi:BTAD domain-containing putative transcriptional regulator [Nonomuraea sp. KM88]|uniref:BTAD domain-containing putative transcriptional regulator n=1 Tax=Nonomuraea sp. KM88 TaxID=3457427 RepID=UPI003FCD993C